MPKPSPKNKVTKKTGAGVVWSCKACGKGSLTTSQAKADAQFSAHSCNA